MFELQCLELNVSKEVGMLMKLPGNLLAAERSIILVA